MDDLMFDLEVDGECSECGDSFNSTIYGFNPYQDADGINEDIRNEFKLHDWVVDFNTNDVYCLKCAKIKGVK